MPYLHFVFYQLVMYSLLVYVVRSVKILDIKINGVRHDKYPHGPVHYLRLWAMHAVVVGFACIVTQFALNSNASIYKMMENAYKVTLVAAFVPLVFGLYWKRTSAQGALFAIALGVFAVVATGDVPPRRHVATAVVWLADKPDGDAGGGFDKSEA